MRGTMASDVRAGLTHEARDAPDSGIVEVMTHGWEKPGIIPLWAGEGDLPTPGFICDAATRSLAAGETFYTYQRGLPELREAIARHHERVFGVRLPAERIIVTASGMQAIHLAVRAVAGTGDTVVIPSPAWPNAAASVGLNGARAKFVEFRFSPDGWHLDVEELLAACDETTKAIIINSPSNPTGWVMPADAIATVLEGARRRGIWIIADEIYAQFYYGSAFGGRRSPSFLDIAEPEDRILFCNTFSKNWAMTGWRVGWLVIPEPLGQTFENLIQYNTSGVAAFMQRAALAAVERGGEFLDFQIERARAGRRIVCDALARSNRIEIARPDGAFYAFFAISGHEDTQKLAKTLVDEANIGLAPGTAFGPGGERFMRLCFARKAEDIEIAMDRLETWLADRA